MRDSLTRSAAEADFTLEIAGVASESLRVLAFDGEEGLSELYRYRVEFASEDPELLLSDLIGRSARLVARTDDGPRVVHGMVCRIERRIEGRALTHYTAELGPQHWLLRRRFNSRVFVEERCSDMSVPGVVQKVLRDAGLPVDSLRLALQRTYNPREMIVQYSETDLDFIGRLLEEEGIYYHFEHADDRHTMVLCDLPSAHTPLPGSDEIAFRELRGQDHGSEFFHNVQESDEIHFGSAGVDDFNERQPRVSLFAICESPQRQALCHMENYTHHLEPTTGKRLAQDRLEGFDAIRKTMCMIGTVRRLLSGRRFSLVEHPIPENNRAYVVTRLMQRATQPQSAEQNVAGGQGGQFECVAFCIPAETPYRPGRTTPRPRVSGPQTALVVGPAGEEIHTDALGRVRVQFHWDHEGRYELDSSCWIRVSQGMAGGQYGMMFLPRVGQEVVVEFIDGDPSRPLITGRVFNTDHMPPYALPAEKSRSVIRTHSTPGGGGANEIRFEDLKDHEQILIYATNDLHVHARRDAVESVGRDRHLTVERDRVERIRQSRHCDVTLDDCEHVGGNKSLEVRGDHAERVHGKRSDEIAGDYYVKTGGHVVIEADASLTLNVQGNFLKIDANGLQALAGLIKLNCAGAVAGIAQPATIVSPKAPLAADTVEPGYDVRYAADRQVAETPEERTDEERDASWIEIEMVDDLGRPWPGEPFEILSPDGKVERGSLNSSGQARVCVARKGTCSIRFPRLDGRAWERIV